MFTLNDFALISLSISPILNIDVGDVLLMKDDERRQVNIIRQTIIITSVYCTGWKKVEAELIGD